MVTLASRSTAAGFGLTEALVALLLLAIATIGAGTAMVESLAAQRAALLRTQAADLAADLAEGLRSAPDAAAQWGEIQAWQASVLNRLPLAQAQALRLAPPSPASSVLPTGWQIRLQWRDGHAQAPALLTLPVSLGIAPGWP